MSLNLKNNAVHTFGNPTIPKAAIEHAQSGKLNL